MCIWCIKIVILLHLHYNPWVESSAGGLLVPEDLFSPVAKYLGTCLKIRIWVNLWRKRKIYRFISKRRIISLMQSSITSIWRIWLNFTTQYFLRLFYSFHNFWISKFFWWIASPRGSLQPSS
jgi:hypothetical protein